jgi:tetratricopeptide (TPR) repeat protein
MTLAQSHGVIFQADSGRVVKDPPDDWSAYSCTLSYYAYRDSVDRNVLHKVRDCLEKAVERFPDYATAWALLAQAHLEDVRFRIPHNPAQTSDDLAHALEIARHAVRLDPYNTRGLQAEMFALFFSKQYEAAKNVGQRAMELNPNDTELMGEYGYRLAVSGEWSAGCPLIRKSRLRNPGMFGYYESGLALCSYFAGDINDAVMWIRKTTVPRNPIYHVIAAAIFAEAGFTDDARRELVWLCLNQPQLIEGMRDEVSIRLGRHQDIEDFLSSMEKAGVALSKPETTCKNLGGALLSHN